jgi:quinoprotein glucose dehydrogenase
MPTTRSRVGVTLLVCAAATVVAWTHVAAGQQRPPQKRPAPPIGPSTTEWPTYGHDPGGTRFSPLTQITPANVAQLQPAWVYHMKPPAAPDAVPTGADTPAQGRGGRGGTGGGFASGETTPLVINGVMYVSTPYGRVVALDPTTGKEKWTFPLPSGSPSTRGVEYFIGDATTPAQIVFGSTDGKLYSIDAVTGEPNDVFGVKGVVDLNTPEILQGLPGNDGLSSPPIMYKNLIIIGGRTQEGPAQGPAGDVRAWDVHSGKLVWTFHSVPRDGEPFHDTWAGDSWKNRSGVNVWGLMTVDVQRGIVYMPFGAPATDRWGGDREGDNLFSTSVVAADANTGKYLWHFQMIHHDIWDGDASAPPLLFDVKQNGKTIPAVALMCKNGLVFIVDRVTGKPIYPVEERPVPQSEVPGEHTAKTQPFPSKPAPLSRMTMTAADIATVTPELQAACGKLIEGVQLGGPYLPVAYNRLRVALPGNHGGVNWGGASFSPQLGYMFVNSNEYGQLQGYADRVTTTAAPPAAGRGGRDGDPELTQQTAPGTWTGWTRRARQRRRGRRAVRGVPRWRPV